MTHLKHHTVSLLILLSCSTLAIEGCSAVHIRANQAPKADDTYDQDRRRPMVGRK